MGEFGADFDEALLKDVMPEYQAEYARAMEAFDKQGLDEFSNRDIRKFAASNFNDMQDQEQFLARHVYRTQIGCNNDFLGNGVTKWKNGSQEYGSVELLTVGKMAPSIQELVDEDRLRIIPAKPFVKV